MKAPTIISKGFDQDIEVKVRSVLEWYRKNWPEEFQGLADYAAERRSVNPKGRSEAGMFMSKGAFPQKVMAMLPAAFTSSFGSKERGLAFWHDNKERILRKFWELSEVFAVNQTSKPKSRSDGTGL